MSQVTYVFPVAGTTPPSAAVMNVPGGTHTLLIAQVNMLDADTSVVVTHNMGLSSAEISSLFPLISPYFQALPSTGETAYPLASFAQTPGNQANAITVIKTGGGLTNFTAVVQLLRPHTLIQ
jgi:hypothetical protein